MTAETDWKAFFDHEAPTYLENGFTKWTFSEVTFLEEVMSLTPGMTILDIGCGVGRHSVELAKRGYVVTGIDLSPGMLAQAQSAAEGASVEVRWVEGNATNFDLGEQFDGVVCLCEGGFGLVGLGEDPVKHDLAILRRTYEHLAPGGFFVLTAMNGYATIRAMTDEHVASGAFDPATMVSRYVDDWELPSGRQSMAIRERLLIPPEVVAMLQHVGFSVEHVWGGTAGEWGKRPVKLDEIEAMYVARKPS
ncbi:MAG: Ubiquinone biosynthesis O-methyltransferase [Fimbriimonadaceae bacterium]|nr:Ubiquinone biosynthesis O-methyltransferase [Fimbriimonadaceae bacterium]